MKGINDRNAIGARFCSIDSVLPSNAEPTPFPVSDSGERSVVRRWLAVWSCSALIESPSCSKSVAA